MANNIVIHYLYEEDLASTKQLLEAHVEDERGTVFEDHEKPFDERYGYSLHTMVVNFPTSWHAIWFVAKLTSHLDFIWYIDAMIDGTLRGDEYKKRVKEDENNVVDLTDAAETSLGCDYEEEA